MYRHIRESNSSASLPSSLFPCGRRRTPLPSLPFFRSGPTAGPMSSNSATEGGRSVAIFGEDLSPFASRDVPAEAASSKGANSDGMT